MKERINVESYFKDFDDVKNFLCDSIRYTNQFLPVFTEKILRNRLYNLKDIDKLDQLYDTIMNTKNNDINISLTENNYFRFEISNINGISKVAPLNLFKNSNLSINYYKCKEVLILNDIHECDKNNINNKCDLQTNSLVLDISCLDEDDSLLNNGVIEEFSVIDSDINKKLDINNNEDIYVLISDMVLADIMDENLEI